MPRPKLKSRGATNARDATNAGGFTVAIMGFIENINGQARKSDRPNFFINDVKQI